MIDLCLPVSCLRVVLSHGLLLCATPLVCLCLLVLCVFVLLHVDRAFEQVESEGSTRMFDSEFIPQWS